jgi:hypothetical protein
MNLIYFHILLKKYRGNIKKFKRLYFICFLRKFVREKGVVRIIAEGWYFAYVYGERCLTLLPLHMCCRPLARASPAAPLDLRQYRVSAQSEITFGRPCEGPASLADLITRGYYSVLLSCLAIWTIHLPERKQLLVESGRLQGSPSMQRPCSASTLSATRRPAREALVSTTQLVKGIKKE